MSTDTQRLAAPQRQHADGPRVCVYVWDLVVRATHWLIALSILELSITGIYIGDPYLISPGPAGNHFIMGWMKALHFYGAIVFTLSVLARIIWMFVAKGPASWKSFIPTTKTRLEMFVGTLSFYLFMRDRPPAVRGHNPVAGLTYTAIFALYLVMIATGLGLYGMSADAGSLLASFSSLLALFGGAQMARWFHHVVMWLLIGFFVHHIFSALLMAIVEKNGTLDSIFSGNKWVAMDEVENEDAL